HSKASHAKIILSETSHHYRIQISDNGIGIKKEVPIKFGLGLTQIKSRLDFLNGDMIVNNLPRGTEITLLIPKKLPSLS
ncbi:hypothetical protein RZS08_38435, partial [Arthrospira platensis SPKY1]|nr:hypothetical protein [Arthrospira platensis SPKY1]